MNVTGFNSIQLNIMIQFVWHFIQHRLSKSSDEDDKKKAIELKELIEERKTEFRGMEDTLPHENGWELMTG